MFIIYLKKMNENQPQPEFVEIKNRNDFLKEHEERWRKEASSIDWHREIPSTGDPTDFSIQLGEQIYQGIEETLFASPNDITLPSEEFIIPLKEDGENFSFLTHRKIFRK